MRRSWLPALALLAGCASDPPKLLPTRLVAPETVETVRTEVIPIPHTVMAREKATPDWMTPQEATRAANRAGLVVPNPRDFLGAHYKPPYVANYWYEVYAAAGDGRQAPNQTDIELEPGEVLYSIAAPDSVLWEIKADYYGDGEERTYVVHAKPRRPYVSAQVTLLTNKRKYTLNLRSFKYDKHVMVSWSYPEQELQAVNASLSRQAKSLERNNDSLHVLPGCQDARYRVIGSATFRPVLSPEGLPPVCNDGRHTRITFPPNLGAMAAPALFQADDEDGANARLINYRIVNSSYVVDGVPKTMILRLGADAVTIVRDSK
jgi:type IV secretion system protein TrbG